MSGAKVLIVNHALFFTDLALRARQGAASCPSIRSPSSTRPTRWKTSPPSTLGCRSPAGRRTICSIGCSRTPRQQHSGCCASRRHRSCRAGQPTRQAVERFLQLGPRRGVECRAPRPAGGRAAATRFASASRASCPTACRKNSCKLAAAPRPHRRKRSRTDEEQIEFEAAGRPLPGPRPSVQAWLGQELPGQVYWIEGAATAAEAVALASAPIEVGPCSARQLFERMPTRRSSTSATLSVGGRRLRATSRNASVSRPRQTCQLGSPFDYRRQAELHLFRRMPDPTADPGRLRGGVPGQDPGIRRAHAGPGVRAVHQQPDDAAMRAASCAPGCARPRLARCCARATALPRDA